MTENRRRRRREGHEGSAPTGVRQPSEAPKKRRPLATVIDLLARLRAREKEIRSLRKAIPKPCPPELADRLEALVHKRDRVANRVLLLHATRPGRRDAPRRSCEESLAELDLAIRSLRARAGC